jgi:hypothetical protein
MQRRRRRRRRLRKRRRSKARSSQVFIPMLTQYMKRFFLLYAEKPS